MVKSICSKLKHQCTEVWRTLKLELPTKQHEKGWKKFERMKERRTQIFILSWINWTWITNALGIGDFTRSRQYIEGGGPHAETLINST